MVNIILIKFNKDIHLSMVKVIRHDFSKNELTEIMISNFNT